jgi:hypothetical protein
MVLPLTALFAALGLEWTGWGQGRFNWGPRVGSLWLLLLGQVAFAGTFAGAWLRTGLDWAAHWLDVAFTYVLGPAFGSAVASLVHWLPAALLGIYWIAGWIGRKERMTWRLAWAGFFIPTFLAAIPGPVGNALTAVFHAAAGIGAAIIGGLFAMAGGSA